MLKLKIRQTVLNTSDTPSANDPYKRWHCSEGLHFKAMTKCMKKGRNGVEALHTTVECGKKQEEDESQKKTISEQEKKERKPQKNFCSNQICRS